MDIDVSANTAVVNSNTSPLLISNTAPIIVSSAPPLPVPVRSYKGMIAVSLSGVVSFLVALIIGGIIAFTQGDYTLLIMLSGVAASNYSTVVSYWLGSSSGSAYKTDVLASKRGD